MSYISFLFSKLYLLYFFFSLFARQREEKVPKRRESTLIKWITSTPCGRGDEWMLRAAPALLLTLKFVSIANTVWFLVSYSYDKVSID